MAEDIKQALDDDELEQVSGGNDGMGTDSIHNLANFTTKTVCNVIHYDATACLTLRKTPNGTIIQGVGWQNGNKIMVHKTYREQGWYFAYDKKSGKYGYVNPNNIK